MWRTALRPRWLVALVVVLVAASGMAALGQWQLRRAQDNSESSLRSRHTAPPVPLESVFGPRQMFPAEAGQLPVTAHGTWDVAHQLLVPDRYRGADRGYLVVTPLRLADGSGVAVVRGWVATEQAAATASASLPATVTVTGLLYPGEAAAPRQPGDPMFVTSGQLSRIDPVELLTHWDFPFYTGFIVALNQEPQPPRVLQVVEPHVDSGLSWQNLSYAAQWWAFAIIGVLLWARLVRDDHRGRLRGSSLTGAGAPDPAGDAAQPSA